MKMRAVMRLVLMTCLLLLLAVPACADVFLPAGLVEIEAKAFIDSAWLRGACSIPEGVTTIGAQAFSGCSGLTSLTIPDTVTYIGSRAFYGCTGLTGTITLPKDAEVAEDAFANCPNLTVLSAAEDVDPAELFTWSVSGGKVTIESYIGGKTVASVVVPSHIDGAPVTAIADYTFSSNRYLTSITLPETLTTIGTHAFSYCAKLQSITLPASVQTLGRYAFYYCSSLTGTLQLIDAEIPSNAFTGCKKLTVYGYETNDDGTLTLSLSTGSQTSLKVPASFGGRVVTIIGREAFARRSTLKSVELPRSITAIEPAAFYYCTALEYITLPEGLISIGANAFYNCTALEGVTFPESLETISSRAFYGCTSYYDTLSFIDVDVNASAFSGCGDVEVWCFSANTNGTLTLSSCRSSHTELVVPYAVDGRSVTGMAPQAFYYCTAVETISLPNSFTTICDEAFYGCTTLKDFAIPSGVTSIGYAAFNGCTSLTSIHVPASVRTIDTKAFSGCKGLTSLTISSVNTTIGEQAFAGCTSLSGVSLPSGFDKVGNMAFQNTAWLKAQVYAMALTITSGCTNDYQRALLLHDWLIGNTAYDLTYTYYGPEGVLFHGLGVCNAYTMTYSMMLDAVGIQNMTVSGTATDKGTGSSGGHAWTLVKLAGDWYHVDTTWDDPIPDGRERHTYFCLTDAQMAVDHQWNRSGYPAARGTTYSTVDETSLTTLALEDDTEPVETDTTTDDTDSVGNDGTADDSDDDRRGNGRDDDNGRGNGRDNDNGHGNGRNR